MTGTAVLPKLHQGCVNAHHGTGFISRCTDLCISNSPRVNAIGGLTASCLRAPNGTLL